MVLETEVYLTSKLVTYHATWSKGMLSSFSCNLCLLAYEINPVAHPIMGGKLEVLHKIKNYLQLIKLKPQPSPPALLIPSSLIIRDLISSLTSNLKRLHIPCH